MTTRHLIIPGSFFPSLGGAQGSMLNFVSLLGNKKEVYISTGIKGYLFGINKDRKFNFTFPYIGILVKFNTYVFFTLLMYRFFYNPKIIWLYGGGVLSAKVLKFKWIFGNSTKIVLRSAGEDIQRDKKVSYGYSDDNKNRKLILKYYPKADYFWSLGTEITKEYISINIDKNKIIETGNMIARPRIKKIQNVDDPRINIGVIGRYHPKKQFELARDVALNDIEKKYKFHFKTPEFFFNHDNKNVEFHGPSSIHDLLNWPPLDVWKFYDLCDLLLITSRIESFGNVTFEAGISGLTIVIQENVTGAKLASNLGFNVITYKDFTVESILNTLSKISKKHLIDHRQVKRYLYKDELINLINKIEHE